MAEREIVDENERGEVEVVEEKRGKGKRGWMVELEELVEVELELTRDRQRGMADDGTGTHSHTNTAQNRNR